MRQKPGSAYLRFVGINCIYAKDVIRRSGCTGCSESLFFSQIEYPLSQIEYPLPHLFLHFTAPPIIKSLVTDIYYKLELSENLTIAPLHYFNTALLYTIFIRSNK